MTTPRRCWLALVTLAFAIALLLTAAKPAAAHEHVVIGAYELIVGWRAEPAVVGSLNGLDLGIEHHLANGTTEWVTGAALNFTATLSFGSSSIAKDVAPQFGRPGWYTFDVIPTRAGTYAVRIVGTLPGQAVDANVTLDDVVARSDIEFPAADPTPSALERSIGTAEAIGAFGIFLGIAALAVAAAPWRWKRSPP